MKTLTDQFSTKRVGKRRQKKEHFLYFVGRALQKLRVLYEHFNLDPVLHCIRVPPDVGSLEEMITLRQ
jgi:hypothetical protein